MSNYSNALIYGANKTERVVSIEANGSDLILFRELEDGTVTQEVMPASYWCLTHKRISSKQDELDGNQFYKEIMLQQITVPTEEFR
mgnify:CR=1 FL=1